jgi:hypothetical protein
VQYAKVYACSTFAARSSASSGTSKVRISSSHLAWLVTALSKASPYDVRLPTLLMRGDPLARTLFGSKPAETTHGTIWVHYLHSPHTAFLNGRHPKMRAARTLYSSRPPTTSPPQAVHPPPTAGNSAPVWPPPAVTMASHLHSAMGKILLYRDSRLICSANPHKKPRQPAKCGYASHWFGAVPSVCVQSSA